MKHFILLMAAMVLTGATVFAQATPSTTTAPTESGTAHLEELRRNGIEALYNLDYDKAQKEFKEISRLYPTSPAGPQLLAARLWIKTLYESRRLQASLYS